MGVQVIGRMIGPVVGDKALDYLVANPAVRAVGADKALLAGAIFSVHPHRLELLGDGEVFMWRRAVTGLQFSKDWGRV